MVMVKYTCITCKETRVLWAMIDYTYICCKEIRVM